MSFPVLLAIFVLSTLLGYKLISNVPSLLHTPLMSGMNAFSGITVLGALTAASGALLLESRILGAAAIILAMINVTGGFLITDRMLCMFTSKKKK